MRHKDHLSKLQTCDHSVQVAPLVLRAIGIVSRFIRSPPAEKVERDYAARRREVGHKAIMEMKIIWEAMHQNDRGFLTRMVAGVNGVPTPLYELFGEVHFTSAPRMGAGSDYDAWTIHLRCT